MEDAVDAIKIFISVIVFAFGLYSLFNLSAQARITSDVLISETDRTKYYEYMEDAGSDIIDDNGNRILEMKDIIPVLYRYAEENYGVTIVDLHGNIVARFDLDTEVACNNWNNADNMNKQKFVDETNNRIYTKVNILASRLSGRTYC